MTLSPVTSIAATFAPKRTNELMVPERRVSFWRRKPLKKLSMPPTGSSSDVCQWYSASRKM
jgi:hypothetical protein